MLHPNQFEVNEAWVAFRLNKAPIHIERDGDFNCIALMDAASCYILGSELIPVVTATKRTQGHARRLLKNAERHKQQRPKTLFVPRGDLVDLVTREAARQHIDVVPVAETELLVFIGGARQEFAERFDCPALV